MQKTNYNLSTLFIRIILYLIVILGACTMLIPFLWMLSTALKPTSQIFTWPPVFIPRPPILSNFIKVWTSVPMGRYFLNSVIVSSAATAISLFTNSLAAFGFAKYRFPGRDIIFLVLLSTLMIPFQVMAIPRFIMMRYFGWLDTYYALIFPWSATAFGIFLIRQFMYSIPDDLMDAAKIDGCSHFKIYFKIALPLCKPALAAFTIFHSMLTWNNLFWPLIVVSVERMKTLPLGLTHFTGQYTTYWNLLMSASTIAALPVLVLFIVFQRHFVKGITLTGIKG